MSLSCYVRRQASHTLSRISRAFNSSIRFSALAKEIVPEEEVPHDIRLHEPAYLNVKPAVPLHDDLQLSLTGHDFPVLEQLQSYVHRLALRLGMDVLDTYAVPPQTMRVTTFRPKSTVPEHIYDLAKYQRVIQFGRTESTTLPAFLHLLTQHIPEGVEISLTEPTFEEEEARYIPDKQLDEMQQQLEIMQEERNKK